MRKKLKGLLGVFLSFVLVLTLMPETCIQVKADTTGTVKALLTADRTMYVICDTNSYNTNDTYEGKTITNVYPCDAGTGNGAMADYNAYLDAPWYSNRDNILAVVIGDDVTRIGVKAFCWCDRISRLTISDSVTSIGDRAFYGCQALGNITIPATITFIDDLAFGRCDALQSITIPVTVLTWGGCSFLGLR
ncbi:MAG: leucine-rich repeat domain-containing protein [Lachnospiraceae bacterium]|nr:leucine-rich repeat domain-containing protein [Lachnospiraceae bacterium]